MEELVKLGHLFHCFLRTIKRRRLSLLTTLMTNLNGQQGRRTLVTRTVARLRPQLHRESNFEGPTSRPAPTVKGPVRMSSIGKIDATTPRILAGFDGTIHKFPLPTHHSIITQPPSPLTPTMLIQPRRHPTTASHLLLSLAGNPIWGNLRRPHRLLLHMQCTSIKPIRQTIRHGLRHIS